MAVGVTVIVAAALSLGACGKATSRSVVGTYDYVGSASKATLVLRGNGTYNLCADSIPCGGGAYHVDHEDEAHDHINFSGSTFGDFEYGKPARGANGNVIKMEGGSAYILYDRNSCPCIGFDDPDSGVFFEKVSD
jgi:hypothetical protein